jgi:adenylate kinase
VHSAEVSLHAQSKRVSTHQIQPLSFAHFGQMFRQVNAVRAFSRAFSAGKIHRLIISGAPASGKGTQCEKIIEEFKTPHLSTGDMLRAAVKAGSPLGKEAKAYMDAGKLVPDSLVINLVKEKLATPECTNGGWLLDGFPRTAEQAKALQQANINPDKVILLDVPDSALIERVTGRRTDPVTGA